MKHPALTRALAVVMAVFCLVTLLAGGGALWKARGDRQEDLRQEQLLRDRIDRAERLSESLAELEHAYAISSDHLDERLESHEKASSDYRGRLATYTATRAGIVMGRAALEQASNALWYGKKKFEDGYAQFAEGAAAFGEIYGIYSRIKGAFQTGWDTYDRGLNYLGESEELEAILTPEEVLLALTVTKDGIDAMESLLQSAIDQPTEDADVADSLRRVTELLAGVQSELGDVNPQALAQRAVEQILARADEAVAARVSQGASEAEALAEADAVTQAALGMSYAEAKAWLQENAAAVGGGQSSAALANIDPDTAAAMLSSFGGKEELLRQALAVLREERQTLDAQEAAIRSDPEAMNSSEALLALLKSELDSAQKLFNIIADIMETAKQQMDAIAAQMEEARKAIEDGITTVGRNRMKLEQSADDLEKQHDDMKEEKRQLEREQTLLDRHQSIVDTYEETNREFRSARAVLMDYAGIAEAVDAGGELIESAEAELTHMTDQHKTELTWRAGIAAAVMAAAILGCLCVAGAFEKPRMKHLWLPTAATALLAALAEAGSVYVGRGLWYSALALLLSALALLPLSFQKKT